MRWSATVYYYTDAGVVDVPHEFDEIEDLHDIIERGPHFGTIERITVEIRYAGAAERLTIEQAAAL